MTVLSTVRLRDTVADSPMALLAAVPSVLGVLAAIPQLISAVRGPAAIIFLFCAPGAAVMLWIQDIPTALRWSLVPAVGLAIVLLLSWIAVAEGLWHPDWELLLLILACLTSVAVWAMRDDGTEGQP